MQQIRSFIEGEWVDGDDGGEVRDKYTAEVIGHIHQATPEQVERAVRGARAGFETTRLTPYERYRVLARASQLVHERRAVLIAAVTAETGFAQPDAENEVTRTAETLLLSGEEAKRITGEVVPMGSVPAGSDRIGFTVRHPLGVVCAITPFNSPLNTVSHKVGPAIAAGNAVVLKPSALTPLCAMLLVELLLDAGVPPELIALVNGNGTSVGNLLLENPVPAFYAFTGSTRVGEHIRRTIGLRRAQLELGSLSSTIVCDDVDMEGLVEKCLNAAFRKSGQVCTSVQRLYVQDAVVPEFLDRAEQYLRTRRAGDPSDPGTYLGPLISEGAAQRVRSWVGEAIAAGADAVVGGGGGDTALVDPTVLAGVDTGMKVMSQEIFGPVVAIRPFSDLDAAIDEVNDTPYGLAAGIFTSDIARAFRAAERLHVGTVHINESSSSRVDLMPFGGTKSSGTGQEGPRYAIREMTEERMITIGAIARGA
jgi:succinate-semialdehyde dehydrogenase/glutarate-semialdehyde dehydrogenase